MSQKILLRLLNEDPIGTLNGRVKPSNILQSDRKLPDSLNMLKNEFSCSPRKECTTIVLLSRFKMLIHRLDQKASESDIAIDKKSNK